MAAQAKAATTQKIRDNVAAFGFNGQQKTDEIAGKGNWNTALFWEYGTREAVRKNPDPVRNPSVSPYAVFDGNPIANSDVNGDQVTIPRQVWESMGAREPYNQQEARQWAMWVPLTITKDIALIAAATMPVDEFIEAGGAAIMGRIESKGIAEFLIGGGLEARLSEVMVNGTATVKAEIRTVSSEELAARAQEIHSALPAATQRRTTTAVATATTQDGKATTLVASSEKRLRPAQRAALKPGEVPVTGAGHAETTILNHAKANGMQVNSVAASRPICQNCAGAIDNAGAKPASALKKAPPVSSELNGAQ